MSALIVFFCKQHGEPLTASGASTPDVVPMDGTGAIARQETGMWTLTFDRMRCPEGDYVEGPCRENWTALVSDRAS